MPPVSGRPESSLRTLTRGLDVLKLFAGDEALTQSQIAHSLELPAPTVHRLVATLIATGFLTRGVDGRQVRLGPEVARLVTPMLDSRSVPEVARPHLERLDALTGETTNLAVLVGAEVVYLDGVRGERMLSTFAAPGRPAPAHATALGKCLLAELDDVQVRQLMGPEPYLRRTRRTLTRWSGLRRALAQIRESDVAISRGEFEDDLVAAAVAVPSGPGSLPVAVNVALPVTRASERELRRAVAALRRCRLEILRDLRPGAAPRERVAPVPTSTTATRSP
jgi:DNA-binding IclR family transcriptional regulator